MGFFGREEWDRVDEDANRIALGETPHVRRMREQAAARLGSPDTDFSARMGEEMAGRRAENLSMSGGFRPITNDDALLAAARIRGGQQNLQERSRAISDLEQADDWNKHQENLRQAFRQRAINQILRERATRNAMVGKVAQLGATALGGPMAGAAVGGGLSVLEG